MRYKVIDESVSAHCCFEATVVDTETLDPVWHAKNSKKTVCECFSRADAQRVARALNAEEAAVSQDTIDQLVAAASAPERYRQQHTDVAALMDSLSAADKQRLADAFNAGWVPGGFGADSYDPEPVDKVLAELGETPDMSHLQALEPDFAKLPTTEKVRANPPGEK